MNFNILTLGCKVNQYESQAMREDLAGHGFVPSDNADRADITVINTCTVTSVSDSKNRKLINRIRRLNPEGIIVLTGCMPQAFPEEMESLASCDIILGNKQRALLVPAIEEYLRSRQRIVNITPHLNSEFSFEKMSVSSFSGHTRAFLKIEDGCNRFCSYCIIPYARGRVRSKQPEDLKSEIEALALGGYKEIVLVGINLSEYGLGEDFDLSDAVSAACSVNGIERVRLGSLEPELMTDELIGKLAAEKKLCPQFHLSLQSGCDRTLSAMNRHYTSSEYLEIVSRLRSAFDNASITTDIMVGFPGETEEDFAQSCKFVKEVGFSRVHVFPYSQRKGTRAAAAPDQLPHAEKERRASIMAATAAETQGVFLNSQIGLTQEVLFERVRHGYLEGYTKNYTSVRVMSADPALSGQIKKVKLVKAEKDYCTGEIC